MKFMGVVGGAMGVGLIVYRDQLKTNGPIANPYDLWLFAGLLFVVGFVMFMKEWKA